MISILCPTRKRPANLIRVIDSLNATARDFELLCYVDDDDDSYSEIEKRFPTWAALHGEPVQGEPEVPGSHGECDSKTGSLGIRIVHGPRIVMSDMWNVLAGHARGDIFMLCGDDVVFRTPGWDLMVDEAFAACPDKILLVHGDDGGPGGKHFASLPFVDCRWVCILGYFAGPGFSADYADTWPNDVADMVGRKKRLPFVVEHLHPAWGKAKLDETYRETQARLLRDDTPKLYADRLPQRIADAAKLREAMHAD